MTAKPQTGWTLAIVSVALFMTALDNLVVGIALPSIPAVREATRDGFRRIVELVQGETGAGPEDVQRFIAKGMLLNVLGAIDAPSVDEPWAKLLMGEDC